MNSSKKPPNDSDHLPYGLHTYYEGSSVYGAYFFPPFLPSMYSTGTFEKFRHARHCSKDTGVTAVNTQTKIPALIENPCLQRGEKQKYKKAKSVVCWVMISAKVKNRAGKGNRECWGGEGRR